MPHRLGVCTVSLASLVATAALGGCQNDKLKGPEAEVKKTDVKLDLPAVPAFDMPPANPDGSHSVKELRVKGKKFLDTDITVTGVITWAYDCPTAVRKPDETDKDLQKRLDDDPTLCERPKFYIGDSASTPAEKSLWIVDVPRPYNKLEEERLKKQDRNAPDRCEPNEKDPKKMICPPYKVGDTVTITGSFKQASPHSEKNSDGLLVYKTMKNTTQNWESPPPVAPPPGSPPAPPPATKQSPTDMMKHG